MPHIPCNLHSSSSSRERGKAEAPHYWTSCRSGHSTLPLGTSAEVEEKRSVEGERGLHDGGPGDTTGQQGAGQDQVGGEGGTGLPPH